MEENGQYDHTGIISADKNVLCTTLSTIQNRKDILISVSAYLQ